jgi:hypothetical protein
MTNEQKIDRLRREISSKTQLRTQLEHQGDFSHSPQLGTDCWRMRGAIERIQNGVEPEVF